MSIHQTSAPVIQQPSYSLKYIARRLTFGEVSCWIFVKEDVTDESVLREIIGKLSTVILPLTNDDIQNSITFRACEVCGFQPKKQEDGVIYINNGPDAGRYCCKDCRGDFI